MADTKEVQVLFCECIQDSQDFGSDDDHMVSRLWVEISVDGQEVGSYIVDLKQSVGGDFDDIEVGPPKAVVGDNNYRGPFNHEAFRAEAKKYFLHLVGPQGRIIRLEGGAKNIRMQGNRFIKKYRVTFPAAGPLGTVW